MDIQNAGTPCDRSGSDLPEGSESLHKANNQLSIILGHADMLAHNLPAGSEHQRNVEAILRAARELARLLRRFS